MLRRLESHDRKFNEIVEHLERLEKAFGLLSKRVAIGSIGEEMEEGSREVNLRNIRNI